MRFSQSVLAGVTMCAIALCIAACAFPAMADTPGLSAALSASPPYTCVKNVYIDAVNGNDSNAGTQAAPWKTISNANNGWPNTPVPGECINVLPGTYTLPTSIVMSAGGNSNTPRGYVVYRSTVPQGAHIIAGSQFSGTGWDLIALWKPYIIIDGFEIDGNKSATSGAGVNGCSGGGGPTNIAHHFIAINNVIHDMGGSGLSSCTADFITWSHNIVYNTSGTNGYQTSGINVWEPKALAGGSYTPTFQDKAPYGIVISYNIAHDNFTKPIVTDGHTDGNGIIIDTSFGSSTCSTCGTPYPGNILVLGNVAYNNGGGGVHIFLSENVTVANNTVYNNYLDTLNNGTARGELSNGGSANVNFINNIAIAVPGSGVLANNVPAISWGGGSFTPSGTWTNNILFGAGVVSTTNSYVNPATNSIGVNPLLANPAAGDFVPLPGSPAIGTVAHAHYIPSTMTDTGAY